MAYRRTTRWYNLRKSSIICSVEELCGYHVANGGQCDEEYIAENRVRMRVRISFRIKVKGSYNDMYAKECPETATAAYCLVLTKHCAS